MKNTLLLLLAAAALTACTTVRPTSADWMPIDGGRDQGAFTLAVLWNARHDRPDLDPFRAQAIADGKCLSWGYRGAEATSDVQTECTRRASGLLGECIRKEARIGFRCVR